MLSISRTHLAGRVSRRTRSSVHRSATSLVLQSVARDQQAEACPTSKQQIETTTNNTAEHRDAVELLERSYQHEAAASAASTTTDGTRRPAAVSKLRPLYIRHALPVLRTVRFTERRLEADLLTIATTIMFVNGFIVWDRGLESMLDGLLGDSAKGSILCILLGLGLVVGVRLSGAKVGNIFSP